MIINKLHGFYKTDFTATSSPMMPKFGKNTGCTRLLSAQISPDMRTVIVPMLFSALGLMTSISMPTPLKAGYRKQEKYLTPAKYELLPIF